jgi:bacillopeptidase F
MTKYKSRLAKTEERKHYRSAFIYIFLTITIFILFVIFGIPSIAKFAAFLTNIRSTGQPVTKSDSTPPVTPRIDPLPEFTNNESIDLKGNTESGATVVIKLNSKEHEVLADKNGDFLYPMKLKTGKNTVSVYSKDSSGNTSPKTDSISIILDNDAPDLEITSPPDGSEYYGSKQRQAIIEGSSENGVSMTINDRVVVVDDDGTFSFLTSLTEGDNNFTIIATDQAGNSSEKQITLKYVN